jgi:hypothetical protein
MVGSENDGGLEHCFEAQGFPLPLRPFLAQNEERKCASRETGGGRGLGPVSYLLLKRASVSACTHKITIGDSDLINVRFGPEVREVQIGGICSRVLFSYRRSPAGAH